FIILEGTVELRNGDHVTEVKSSGDVIGAVAFLLHSERLADMYAVTDDVEILSMRLVSLSKYAFSSH
ncbi:MAG: cyclic nucleotide-binding domain-containing protein, partial [Gammaproteobacteria bacterium]|nr:cyclic nucleotide-binding domain-containing protein [Gammaproteobacteria bacterium]